MQANVAARPLTRLMREPEGTLPNVLAIGYTFGGHVLGLWLLTLAPLWWLPGVLLTAHTMVVAAYLIHESAHSTVFRSRQHNRWLGELMGWLCGSNYASFERVRHMHLRHHLDRADVALFDYRQWLRARSRLVRRLIHALEWVHVPVIELVMHYQLLVRPFTRPRERFRRPRVVLVAASRLAFFLLLAWLSPWALLLYAVGYWLFLTVLNLNDAFHHTFDQYFVDDDQAPVPMEGKDRVYEQANTWSNVVSARHPWLNWLTLNFGYHNAHHEKVAVPWYRLPQLHRELYGEQSRELMDWPELLRTFHRNRIRRVLDDDYGTVGQGANRADGFVGAHGVSFLTVV
jgi:fatty acid desaturase